MKRINDTNLLHCLRYVAYGYSCDGDDKRCFDNSEVIWPGNLTKNHKPRLVYKNEVTGENFTLYFSFENDLAISPIENYWKIRVENQTEFYWEKIDFFI